MAANLKCVTVQRELQVGNENAFVFVSPRQIIAKSLDTCNTSRGFCSVQAHKDLQSLKRRLSIYFLVAQGYETAGSTANEGTNDEVPFASVRMVRPALLLRRPPSGFKTIAACSSRRTGRGRLEDTKPLFITHVVQAKGVDAARNLSKVKLPPDFPVFEAYSGYITVNEAYDSNMFFFLVKAKTNASNLPLTIWMEGGPGFSGLLAMFTKNGPVGITKEGVICARLDALTEHTHVVYLDAPVGGGFSFTNDTTRGLSKNLTDTSTDIAQFLRQFLGVFPEYSTSDLYVGGESYGGRLAVGFANYISENKHQESSEAATQLNLKGVIAGSPFLGPLLETIDSSEFLFSVGMLNTTSKLLFHQAFENITAETNRTIQLFTFFRTVFQNYTKTKPTLFQRLTGYNFHASVIHPRIPQEIQRYKEYVNTSDFKTRIHVGSDAVWRKQMPSVVFSMGMVDFFTNITLMVQSVFDKYRVLIYGGQLDTIFPAINMDRFYNSLEWGGSEDFKKERVGWYDDDDPDYLNGYVKKGGNVTYVLLVGAGHDPGFDAPKPTHRMIGQFLKQQEIVKSLNSADDSLKGD